MGLKANAGLRLITDCAKRIKLYLVTEPLYTQSLFLRSHLP